MKSSKWFDEASTVDANVFPMLGDRRTYVICSGRCSGKNVLLKKYIDEHEKVKQEKKKVKIHSMEKQPKIRENKVLLRGKGFTPTPRRGKI